MSERNRNTGAVGATAKERHERKVRYWLAYNRHKVTLCQEPCADWPTPIPTPEFLIGFSTKEDRSKWKHFLLKSQSEMIQEFFQKTLPKLARAGKVLFKRFTNPEMPSSGTVWSSEGGAA